MNVINYEIFHCTTVSTAICGKSNALRNWTLQKIRYCRTLISNFYVLQGYVTGISNMLLVLILIQTHPIFRHLLRHLWHVLWTKIQNIQFLIQLV